MKNGLKIDAQLDLKKYEKEIINATLFASYYL
jgi:hypothetical protein